MDRSGPASRFGLGYVGIFTGAAFEHPLWSVTVTLYVPGITLLIDWVYWAGIVFQRIVYGALPPATFTMAVPFDIPGQLPAIWSGVIMMAGGSVIVAFAVSVQP
jgi:hypothetical protein